MQHSCRAATTRYGKSIDAAAAGWDTRTDTAVVLGAGGAGRGVVYGLIQRGITNIHVVNRTRPKADAIAFTVDQAMATKSRAQSGALKPSNAQAAKDEDDGICLSCGA